MIADTINTLCTDLLQTCIDAYTTIPGAPAAPAFQFVSFGEPLTYPDSQLAVWCTGIRLVNPFPVTKSSTPNFAAVMPAADLMVLVQRACWPTPSVTTPSSSSLPKTADIQAAAIAANLDASVLTAHLTQLSVKGGMFPSLPIRNGDVSMSPLLPVGPAGGHVGWRGTVTVKLAIL